MLLWRGARVHDIVLLVVCLHEGWESARSELRGIAGIASVVHHGVELGLHRVGAGGSAVVDVVPDVNRLNRSVELIGVFAFKEQLTYLDVVALPGVPCRAVLAAREMLGVVRSVRDKGEVNCINARSDVACERRANESEYGVPRTCAREVAAFADDCPLGFGVEEVYHGVWCYILKHNILEFVDRNVVSCSLVQEDGAHLLTLVGRSGEALKVKVVECGSQGPNAVHGVARGLGQVRRTRDMQAYCAPTLAESASQAELCEFHAEAPIVGAIFALREFTPEG